jgi:hypothetical protein
MIIRFLGNIAAVCLLAGCVANKPQVGVTPDSLTPTDWVALSKPGTEHELLNLFVGSWDVKVSSWSEPKAAPQVSPGFSRSKWILGSRFVEERFDGLAVGVPYKGRGIMGYDAGAKQFTSVWMDSLNTAIALSKGEFSPDTRSFQLKGEVYDPLLGRDKETLTEIQLLSPDEYEITMTSTGPNGQRFRSLALNYRRAKDIPPTDTKAAR